MTEAQAKPDLLPNLLPRTPLGLFAVVWAFAASLHHLEAQPLAGLPLYPFVILLFLYPDRVPAIASFAVAHVALLWFDLPAAANHSVLAFLVDICLLIGCVGALRWNDPASRGRNLWDNVQGPIRATVLVVYALAVFHKLNSSFFDPEVSCATSQLAKMFTLHGFPERPELASFAFNIYLTLAFEIAILILLTLPRLSHLGVLLGLVFHTLVAWAQFFDFGTVMFALYLFFLPHEGIERAAGGLPRSAGLWFFGGVLGVAVTSFYFHGIRENTVIVPGSTWSLQAETLICLFWTVAIWVLLLPVFISRSVRGGVSGWAATPVAWAVPAIALINGATSYLGLKTVSNYSMFSNLRTEGGQTNHFLVPAGRFFLAGYQNDLVRVEFVDREAPEQLPLPIRLAGGDRWVRRNSRWLREIPESRVPFMEVRRTLQLWKQAGFSQVALAYERNDSLHEVGDAFADARLMRPLSFWERKLLAFRAVQDDGQESLCRW